MGPDIKRPSSHSFIYNIFKLPGTILLNDLSNHDMLQIKKPFSLLFSMAKTVDSKF